MNSVFAALDNCHSLNYGLYIAYLLWNRTRNTKKMYDTINIDKIKLEIYIVNHFVQVGISKLKTGVNKSVVT